jgi:CheY-like chemotaxis protein
MQESFSVQGRVLLMDDEPYVLDSTGDMLQSIGYAVEKARDGSEVLRLYEEAQQRGKPFDFVVLDLIVPGGMGGRETIRELLRIDPEVKAVVSSGYSTDPIVAKYREYGFISALEKPYRLKELRFALKQATASLCSVLN